MSSEHANGSEPDRERPSRWRRLGRFCIWCLGALVVLLLCAWLVLESDWAREKIRRRVVVEVGEALGRDVAIAELDFDLLPPSVEITGLVVGGPRGLDEPFASIDRLTIEAGPGLVRSLLGDGPLVLSKIDITRPRISIVFYEDGSSNLPDLPDQEPPEDAGLEVRIGALDLRDGELRLDERSLPLDFSAEQFEASLVGVAAGDLRLEAGSRHLRADLLDGTLEGTLSLRARLADGGADLEHAQLRGDNLNADANGSYRDEMLRITATVNADLAILQSLGIAQEVAGTVDLEAHLVAGGATWSVETRARSESLGLEEMVVQQIEVEGSLAGDGDAWSVTATATSPEMSVAGFAVQRIEIGVTGSDQGLGLELRRAELAHGNVRGTLDLPTLEGAEIGLALTVDGINLADILTAIEAPVSGLEGLMSGQLAYRFTTEAPLLGDGHALIRIVSPEDTDLTVPPTSEEPAWSLQLEGAVPVSIADGVLRLEEASLTAPGQRISLAGEVRLEEFSADVRFGLDTADPRALLRTLPAIYEDDASPLWEPSRGHGTVNGTFSANQSGFRTDLELELLSAVVTGSTVPRITGTLAIDSGGIQDLQLRLYRDGSSVDVAARVPFETPVPGFETPDFRVDLKMTDWNVGDAEPWLELDLPFDGQVSGELQIRGTTDAPSGQLVATVRQIAVAGLELEAEISGEIRFDPDLVEVGPLRLTAPAGDLELEGSFALQEEELDLRLSSSPLNLAAPPFDDWVAGYLAGVAELSAELTGSLTTPQLEARITGSGLALSSRTLGDEGSSRLDTSWADGRVEVSGSLLGLIEADGGGRLDDEADLVVEFKTAALAEILELAMGQAPDDLAGHFSGAIVVKGPTEAPRIEARLDELQLTHLNSRLVNVEPVVVSFGEEGLRLESLFLEEEGTGSEIFAQGDLGSSGEEMDLRVVSTIDAAWLDLYIPDLELVGNMELLAVVRGTPDSPQIDGQARLVDGRLILEGFPHAIDEIEGFLFFYPGRIVIDSGQASFAGGELLMEGDLVANAQDEWSSELRFQGTDLDLRYPEDWRIRGDARLVLSTTSDGSTFNGIVNLDNASFVRDFQLGFTQLLRVMFQRRPELVAETDEFLVGTRLNIAVEGPDALRIQTNLADLRGDLDFTVRGSMALPVILGEISLARGGEVGLGGTQYRVERGVLTFANPFRNDPHVDLIASAQVRSYDVRLNVFGPAEDLQTSLSSTPPMSNLDIVSMLTTGSADTLGEFGSTSVTDTGGASAEAFLASQAASFAGQRVGNLLGFDQVQITPLTGGSADLSAARVTVGRRISRDVFVTYSHDPSESEEGIFELTWQIYPSIALILTRSDNGSVAVDVQWDTTF